MCSPHYLVVHTQVTQRPPPALEIASLWAAVAVAPRPPQYEPELELCATAPQPLTNVVRTLQPVPRHFDKAPCMAAFSDLWSQALPMLPSLLMAMAP